MRRLVLLAQLWFAYSHRVSPVSGCIRYRTHAMMQELNFADLATASIDNVLRMCGEDVEPPKSLVSLKLAVKNDDEVAMSTGMYNVLVEQTLDYDTVGEGEAMRLKATSLDYSQTDDDRVKQKMRYVYSYGISMYQRGLIAPELLKDIVLNRLASRVGMDGPAFDQWLEMPPAA
eukprot:CAMPEP_0119303138 /NCGR_PEP_ID=MMETSP1333-20130426/4624_1 /TAXON_ID=418940 /ORGANISM="Scyphosphaera apsteinii, Strain RCC1455" /LENGTH=173 /DNA_ID=CAMNT_0007305731 /DNA_START=45 /DNA_END=566 /DNA_ORIENTATION=+